ncbi:uncharacterized protein LOC134254058 [Saccostrea cucullata]|uniref:uncharacterized protein LOC134254058 n=1 Tax=Saccostrea cuccullata TaxID=36930 RepID=UPI002ED48ABD
MVFASDSRNKICWRRNFWDKVETIDISSPKYARSSIAPHEIQLCINKVNFEDEGMYEVVIEQRIASIAMKVLDAGIYEIDIDGVTESVALELDIAASIVKKHPGQKCEACCQHCDALVCMKCVIASHQNHNIRDIPFEYHDNRKKIMLEIEEIQKQLDLETLQSGPSDSNIKDKISKTSLQFEELDRELEKARTYWHQEVDEMFDTHQDLIKSLKNKALKSLTDQRYAPDSKSERMIQTINENKEILRSKTVFRVINYKPNPKKYQDLPADFDVNIPSLKLNADRGKLSIEFGEHRAIFTQTLLFNQTSDNYGSSLAEPFCKLIADIQTSLTDHNLESIACLESNEAWVFGGGRNIVRLNLDWSVKETVYLTEETVDISVTQQGELICTDFVNKAVLIFRFGRADHIKAGGHMAFAAPVQAIFLSTWLWMILAVIKYENTNGYVCASDGNAKKVVVVDEKGAVRYEGCQARRKKYFCPEQIATDSKSQIIVTDHNNDCLHILDQNGQFLQCIDNCGLDTPGGLSIESQTYETCCQKCDLLVCRECVITSHKSHNIEEIPFEYYENRKTILLETEELQKRLDSEEQIIRRKSYISEVTAKINELERKLKGSKTDWHKEVDDIFNKYQVSINTKKNRALKPPILVQQILAPYVRIRKMENTIHENKYILRARTISKVVNYKSKLLKYPFDLSLSSLKINTDPGKELSIEFEGHKATLTQTQLFSQTSDNSVLSSTESSGNNKMVADTQTGEDKVVADIQTPLGDVYAIVCTASDEAWIVGKCKHIYHIDVNGSVRVCITVTGKSSDISLSPYGELTYTDCVNNTVMIVRLGLVKELIKAPEGWKPRGLCCTKSGDILVNMTSNDYSNQKIVRYKGQTVKQEIENDSNGKPIYRGGRNERKLVVVDKKENVRFRYKGSPARRKKYFCPEHIANDSKSQIIVTDDNNDCLHILDQNGQFLQCVDDCGLDTPGGLSVDGKGRYWVGLHSGKLRVVAMKIYTCRKYCMLMN